MSDKTVLPAGQGAAVPETPAVTQEPGTPAASGQQQATPEAGKSEYISRADAEAMIAEAVNQAKSYADKGRESLRKQVVAFDQALKAMELAGQTFTDQQKDDLRSKFLAKAKAEQELTELKQPEGEPAPNQPEAQAGTWEQRAKTDPFAKEVYELQREAGVFLEDGDPELATLKRTGRMLADLQNILQALNAKKARLNPGGEAEPTSASARIPTGSGAPAPGIAQSAADYWRKAYQKKN